MNRIVCFHLYNDFSGSPIVLRMVLEGLLGKGFKVDLVTSDGGVLDELVGMDRFRKHSYFYRFSLNPIVTMARYVMVQIYTFFMALRWTFNSNTVFYINTLLPVGPALAGRIMGKRVVYHYHENAFVKGIFYKTLSWMMQRLAHEIICVSEYQASSLADRSKVRVVPNALPKAFVEKMRPDAERTYRNNTILMIASLKSYKGTREFIDLSMRMPEYKFILVLNDSQENISEYITSHCLNETIGDNLTIYPRQKDVTQFYNQASLLLNLSDKNRFIETFGMTVLEAMSAGLPVIVPTVGGVAEMVDDGVNGYKIDVCKIDNIARRIREIMSDKDTYSKMSHNALKRTQLYNSDIMIEILANTIISQKELIS
ncbi:MAG: glycosyltransferase family 4 protein [Prevotella sp.]